jgi:lysophospholipase L1-like esterase
MKTIVAFGDSLTWGMNARTGGRHAHEDQWPAVLEAGLKGRARVINAGLNGRTTMFDDYAAAADRNGARVLPTILATFDPIDLIIIMLGSNDVKTFVSGSAVAAAQGVRRLVEIVASFPYAGGHPVPRVLIVAPPKIEQLGPSPAFPLLSPRSAESESLAATYDEVAKITDSAFFDAGVVASALSGGDGVHLDAANTRAIGEALVPIAGAILGISAIKAA